MSRFIKKPSVIDAEQWFPPGHEKADDHLTNNSGLCLYGFVCLKADSSAPDPHIHAGQSVIILTPGDWIARQIVAGKIDVWAIDADIFAATYEPEP